MSFREFRTQTRSQAGLLIQRIEQKVACTFGNPAKRLEMQSKVAPALLLIVLLGAAAGGRAAQPGGDNAFTLYAGYRDGGRFTDVTTGSKLPIEASGVGAVSLDLALNPEAGTQFQVYVSRQQSQVDARAATQPLAPATPIPAKFPMAVTYAHVGESSSLA